MTHELVLTQLYKGSEWSMVEDDYLTLEWFSKTTKPTKAKLESQYNEALAAKEAEAKATATQKAALLARLGITADEAKLLIG